MDIVKGVLLLTAIAMTVAFFIVMLKNEGLRMSKRREFMGRLFAEYEKNLRDAGLLK